MAAIDPADTSRLVSRALWHGSTVLAVLVAGAAAGLGAATEAAATARGATAAAAHATALHQAGAALVVGLLAVLVAHLAVSRWARGKVAERLDREWAAVERHWSQPSPGP